MYMLQCQELSGLFLSSRTQNRAATHLELENYAQTYSRVIYENELFVSLCAMQRLCSSAHEMRRKRKRVSRK